VYAFEPNLFIGQHEIGAVTRFAEAEKRDGAMVERRATTAAIGAILVLTQPVAGRGTPTPSFPCAKATTLDERAICSDARLAELDRLQAHAFSLAKRRDSKQAIEEARRRLEERRRCGNDRVCILDLMSHVEGITLPAWVAAYRKSLVREVLKDDLSMNSYSLIGKRTSFPLTSKGEQATLAEIDGVDTDHASAVGRTTRADYFEYCERDPGGMTKQSGGRLTVRECVQKLQTGSRTSTYRSRANCKAKQLTLWDGTWQFLRYSEGAIIWRNPTGAVEQPWSGTAAVDGQFQLLCPNTLARLRADAQPVAGND
jgi:hypothetical protein